VIVTLYRLKYNWCHSGVHHTQHHNKTKTVTVSYGFTSQSTQTKSFQRHSQTFITKKNTKQKPSLVDSYELRPGNGAGLTLQLPKSTWGTKPRTLVKILAMHLTCVAILVTYIVLTYLSVIYVLFLITVHLYKRSIFVPWIHVIFLSCFFSTHAHCSNFDNTFD